MREIKFRAWDKISGCMYETFTLQEVIMSRDSQDLVEHLEYMQFTGLKDSEGVEVFEGDILDNKTKATTPLEVVWVDKWGKFVLQGYKIPHDPKHPAFVNSVQRVTRMKIIGNIFQGTPKKYE